MTFRKQLIFILLGVVCLNFLLVYLSFQAMIRKYIQNEVQAQLSFSMENMVDLEELPDAVQITIEATQAEPLPEWIGITTAQNHIVDIGFLVIDNEGTVLYQSDDSPILEYYEAKPIDLAQTVMVETKNDKSLAYMSYLAYQDDYHIVMYADGTMAMEFAGKINLMLAFLMAGAGGIVIAVGFYLSKGLRCSIKQLGVYAKEIGEGSFNGQAPVLPYMELNQLGKDLEQMAETLKRYHETQKKFFQDASHQLRTPLMSIQGYAEGIVENVFDDEKEAAKIILDESREMGNLVSMLLYLSRQENIKETLQLEQFCLDDLIFQAIEKVAKTFKQKGKEIIFVNQSEMVRDYQRIEIVGDREKLLAALLNILTNSLRYCVLAVTVFLKKNKEGVCILIQDDGTGISNEDFPHIFERFYAGQNGQSGIGLAIAKETIEAHGGEITANNKECGACFTIFLRQQDETLLSETFISYSTDS